MGFEERKEKAMPERLVAIAEECSNEIAQDVNHRFKSWEYCYSAFRKARENREVVDRTVLCMHLSSYLASFGMYCRAVPILQKDYLFHRAIVDKLLEDPFDQLVGIECRDLLCGNRVDLVFNLAEEIKRYYYQVGGTYTLATKILLGTLGCTSAYDTVFLKGLKKYKDQTGEHVAVQRFSQNSLRQLCHFYERKRDLFGKAIDNFAVHDANGNLCGVYPQMRFLDVVFWRLGSEDARE